MGGFAASPTTRAEALFSDMGGRLKGYVGPTEVLDALASDLFLTCPNVAGALAGAAIETCGHLDQDSFVQTVQNALHLGPASASKPVLQQERQCVSAEERWTTPAAGAIARTA